MAIPFYPPPPDELAVRRLYELVEELYILIVCHLMGSEQAVKQPETQKRRGASCTDDQNVASLNVKRDGGDSDSDPDYCTAATTASSGDSVFAEVAAELNLVQQEDRRHPGDLMTLLRKKLLDGQPRPSASRTPGSCSPTSGAPSPSSCHCQGLSQDWKNVGEPMTQIDGGPNPNRNSEANQKRTRFGSVRSFLRRCSLKTMLTATVTSFIGYRLFCWTNFLNVFYP